MPRQSVSPWCNSVAFPASTTPLPCCLCVLCADHSHGAQRAAPRAGTRPTQLPCPQGLFVRSVYCHGLSDGTGRRAPAGGGRLCRFLKLLSVCEDRVCLCDGGSSHVLDCCYAGMWYHLFALPLYHRCRPLGPLAARRQGSAAQGGPERRSRCIQAIYRPLQAIYRTIQHTGHYDSTPVEASQLRKQHQKRRNEGGSGGVAGDPWPAPALLRDGCYMACKTCRHSTSLTRRSRALPRPPPPLTGADHRCPGCF